MLPEELSETMGISFSAEQLEAITAPLAPAVIIAGAGTGKTTVMAARVVWLVANKQLAPAEVLGLTFTRKAAGELAHRIDGALRLANLVSDSDIGREQVATYDSFAAGLASQHGIRMGREYSPRLIDAASAFQLMGKTVRGANEFSLLPNYSISTIIDRALELDAAMQSHLVSAAELRSFTREARTRFAGAPTHGVKKPKPYTSMLKAVERCDERLELLQLVEGYQLLKSQLSVAEFADQLRFAAELAEQHPAVGEDLRQRYRLVLLDEYQDTSSAQAKLLSTLFAGHPVTAVGDPFQAIYGWRGAAASNILEFQKDFGSANSATLSINRRSDRRILAIGNELKSTIDAPAQVQLTSPPDTAEGVIEAAAFDTEAEELANVVERIVALEGTIAWRDIAVLSRRNSTLGELHNLLRVQGVPTEVIGLGGLLGVAEVAMVVAMLRLLANPLENSVLADLLAGPRWAVGLSDMVLLASFSRKLAGNNEQETSLLEAVLSPPPGLSQHGKEQCIRFAAEYHKLRQHRHDPVIDLIHRIITESGLVEELYVSGSSTRQLDAFISACAARPIVAGDQSLAGLLAYLEAEERTGIGFEQATISAENSVKLLTMHRAKGLEWDTVFLVGLTEGIFPARNQDGNWVHAAAKLPNPLRGDAHAIAELSEYSDAGLKEFVAQTKVEHASAEDRLAYVAATRAKRRLVGSCHEWAEGIQTRRKPARYFEVLAAEAKKTAGFLDQRSNSEENPAAQHQELFNWPERLPEGQVCAQLELARLVEQSRPGNDWVSQSGRLTPEEVASFERWDAAITHVLAPFDNTNVILPEGLTATAAMALRSDPQAFAEQLLRRMPRRPSQAAALGTDFHDWVQRRFELPESFEEFSPHTPDPALASLIAAFERGQFRDREPIAVEVSFVLPAGKFQLRGRIDAAYRWSGEYDEIVVDWKISDKTADELQLAIYRKAWAEARGLPISRVGAAFYHVSSDRLEFVSAAPEMITAALEL